jgi:CelD/BcsL family acetyltransferase involved in cellulose biosynthesis
MEIQVVDAFARLAREWDVLADRCAAPPFLRPGWFEAWWRAFGRGRLTLFAGRRDGRLVAVGAFARRRGRLSALANVHSPFFALLGEDHDAERELAQAIYEQPARHVAMPFVLRTPLLEDAGPRTGRLLVWTPLQRSPYVRLNDDFAAFEASLSKRFVTDIRRRRRALGREGAISVEVVDERRRADALLEEAFQLESSGWKDARGTAIASREDTHTFYTDVARWAADAGFLRLAFLRLDGRAIAFEYAFDDGRSWWFLKGGVDPALKRFAPGKLLAHGLIERAYENGLQTFEFLGADELWKRDWRPEYRELFLQLATRRSPLALAETSLLVGYRRYALPLARRTLAGVR